MYSRFSEALGVDKLPELQLFRQLPLGFKLTKQVWESMFLVDATMERGGRPLFKNTIFFHEKKNKIGIYVIEGDSTTKGSRYSQKQRKGKLLI